MIQFQAKTLEEAYEKATLELKCSITNLDINIIQAGSSGFLGFFSKDTIIEVSLEKQKNTSKEKPTKPTKQTKQTNIKHIAKTTPHAPKQKIFNDFYNKEDTQATHNNITIKKDENLITKEIEVKINLLFSHICYTLDEIKVSFYNEDTIYIEFKGKDAALLIGKEGYRYKALSYILFNWIHEKYNLMLRLEVAEFLTTQEEAIYNYLIPVIETIKENGFYKTKPLDGVLVHIALTKLRYEFPDKYVAVKTNIKGDKYILVNDYRK